jgi:hypothetical protein
MLLIVTVAAGEVINHSAGGCPISRTAVVISPGALVMALIDVWGRATPTRERPPTEARSG